MSGTAKVLLGLFAAVVVIGGGVFAFNRFQTASQASAEAMPPSVNLYASFDAVNLFDVSNIERVQNAFEPFSEEEMDTTEELDAEAENELGINFTEDVLPWVGRSIGLGITDLSIDQIDGPMPEGYIIAIEVRDSSDADEFLEKFSTEYPTKENGNPLSEAEYDGVSYFVESEAGALDFPIIIGRSDSLMIIASSEDDFKAAVDAQAGENLTNVADYNDVLANLPAERAMTFYAHSDVLQEIIDQVTAEFPDDALDGTSIEEQLSAAGVDALRSLGMSGALVDKGIKMDFATLYDVEALTDAQKQSFLTLADLEQKSLELLPIDTYALISGPGIGNNYEQIRESFDSALGEDIDDAMLLAEEFVGFNPLDDFLPLLVGETAIALFPSENNILTTMAPTNLGFAMLFGHEDEAAMGDIYAKINEAVELNLGAPVAVTDEAGFSLTTVDFGGEPFIAAGFSGDYLMFATGPQDLVNLYSEGEKLGENARFLEAQAIFDDSQIMTAYVDLQPLITEFNNLSSFGLTPELEGDAEEVANDFRNFETIAFATGVVESGTTGSLMIFLADAP